MLPIAGLMPTNVTGTANIVQLCLDGHSMLCHLSSTSAEVVEPERGYGFSKKRAEMVVEYAQQHFQLEAQTVRLGLVGPHSITGDCNERDWFVRRFLEHGVSSLAGLRYTPVNVVAETLVSSVSWGNGKWVDVEALLSERGITIPNNPKHAEATLSQMIEYLGLSPE